MINIKQCIIESDEPKVETLTPSLDIKKTTKANFVLKKKKTFLFSCNTI